ncbi:MAG: PilN domain-containing protein [Gemmatimonadales bacterium]
MITINLRPGIKRKRAGASKAAFLGQLRDMATKVKEPLLLVAVAVCVVVGAWLGWGFISANHAIASLTPRLERARDESKRFENLMREKGQAERIRDSLVTQIGVIRSVDGERYVWPHVLDEVAKAVPAYTWLASLTVTATPQAVDTSTSADTTTKTVPFELQGRTVDIQAYTKFLRQLEASPWIENVTPIEAKTVVEHERPVTAFSLRANFRRADSAYVRTVPLSQSAR